MTGPNGRRPRIPRVAEVLRTERLTPHMIRVVLGGDGLAGFPAGEFTDHYVKLLFPPDAPDPERPVTRTYTVRAWDAAAGELTLDFVWHGDEGLAGPWAANAQPGDRISFFGPGGAYAPAPDADWHLLAGDESALPAIGTLLEALPPDTEAAVHLEIGGDDARLELPRRANTRVQWHLRRSPGAFGAALLDAARGVGAAGETRFWVACEARAMRDIRRCLLDERHVPKASLTTRGYWRVGQTDYPDHDYGED